MTVVAQFRFVLKGHDFQSSRKNSCRDGACPVSRHPRTRLEHKREGHDFTACGKTHECADHRGRAALQGRVSPVKSARALALVVALSRPIAFFRSLFSRAVNAT